MPQIFANIFKPRGEINELNQIVSSFSTLRGCSYEVSWPGYVIFIPRSYGIFYLTAESLLRHCKKIVLITWLLSGKFYIFNMDFRRLQQFHFTVYSIMNMITAFSILLQLHGILLILVLLILDFTYLVVIVVASLKSNLERIPKHTHAL